MLDVTCTARSDWYLPGQSISANSFKIWVSLAAWFWLTANTRPLPNSTGHGIAQTVLDEGLTEQFVGRLGEKFLLEVLGNEALFLLPVLANGGHHCIALLG